MKRPIKPLYLIEKWIFAAPPSPAAEIPLNLVEMRHNHNPPIWQLEVLGVVAVSVAESEKAKTFRIQGVNFYRPILLDGPSL